MVMGKRNSDFLKHCQTSKLRSLLLLFFFVSWISESKFGSMKTFSRQYNNPFIFQIPFLPLKPLRKRKSQDWQKKRTLSERHTVLHLLKWTWYTCRISYRLFQARWTTHWKSKTIIFGKNIEHDSKCFLIQSSNKRHHLPLVIEV